MGIIRFIYRLFVGSKNKLWENLEEWDKQFEKGKLKKGRRFR
jgi:hypothetical protein|tara:strand:+ start:438 stop:563 length:126 start_codon:yes stop_codon:yes gene_type:complete